MVRDDKSLSLPHPEAKRGIFLAAKISRELEMHQYAKSQLVAGILAIAYKNEL
jgi:hypothetical protein